MGNWNLKKLFSGINCRQVGREDNTQSIIFPNEPYLGKPTEVFAWLGIPESPAKKAPGMVLIHGGGGKAYRQWVEMWVKRGYAAIAMDLSGRDAEGNRLTNGGPEQDHAAKFSTEAKWEDMWTYHAIAAVIRANSILRSVPEVDAKYVGVTGISWGGYLACIAAGVDRRFACAIPVYGCGFLQDNSAEVWMKIFAAMTPRQKKDWHKKCDPSVYLPSAKMPILFVSGTNDFAYPLDSLIKTYSLPRGPVTLCVRHEMPHGHDAGWSPVEIGLFADQHLRSGLPLPVIGPPKRKGNKVSAQFSSASPVSTGRLLYTLDRGPWQTRKWHLGPASIARNVISAELSENASVYFLAVEDKRKAYSSSPHEEICIP